MDYFTEKLSDLIRMGFQFLKKITKMVEEMAPIFIGTTNLSIIDYKAVIGSNGDFYQHYGLNFRSGQD